MTFYCHTTLSDYTFIRQCRKKLYVGKTSYDFFTVIWNQNHCFLREHIAKCNGYDQIPRVYYHHLHADLDEHDSASYLLFRGSICNPISENPRRHCWNARNHKFSATYIISFLPENAPTGNRSEWIDKYEEWTDFYHLRHANYVTNLVSRKEIFYK